MTGRHRAGPGSAEGVDAMLAAARAGLDRVEPRQLAGLVAAGAHVIDIRGPATRDVEGHIPGAVVVDRLVLEWRLCPTSGHRMPDAPDPEDVVVVVCNEGYSSSLAARDLQLLGLPLATDLVDGFRGYAAAGLPVDPAPTRYVS